MFCLDKAFGFMYDAENLSMADNWIFSGKVVLEGHELDTELTQDQKYALIKSYYASPHFNLDQKKKLKELIFKSDNSDKG